MPLTAIVPAIALCPRMRLTVLSVAPRRAQPVAQVRRRSWRVKSRPLALRTRSVQRAGLLPSGAPRRPTKTHGPSPLTARRSLRTRNARGGRGTTWVRPPLRNIPGTVHVWARSSISAHRMFNVSPRRVPSRRSSLTAAATTWRGTLLPLEDRVARGGRERVERVPERLDLVVREHTLARALRSWPLHASGRVPLDQLLAKAPTERRADQRVGTIRSNRSLASNAFQESAQLDAGHPLRAARAQDRRLNQALERPPIVAVGGRAASALAAFDVLLHEAGHRQRFAGLALRRGGILSQRRLPQGCAREFAGIGEAQRRQRPERRTAQPRADSIEDAGRAPIARRDANAETWEAFVEELEPARGRRTRGLDGTSGESECRHWGALSE